MQPAPCRQSQQPCSSTPQRRIPWCRARAGATRMTAYAASRASGRRPHGGAAAHMEEKDPPSRRRKSGEFSTLPGPVPGESRSAASLRSSVPRPDSARPPSPRQRCRERRSRRASRKHRRHMTAQAPSSSHLSSATNRRGSATARCAIRCSTSRAGVLASSEGLYPGLR